MDGEPRTEGEQDAAYWKARAEKAEDALKLAQLDVYRVKKALRNHRCNPPTPEEPPRRTSSSPSW